MKAQYTHLLDDGGLFFCVGMMFDDDTRELPWLCLTCIFRAGIRGAPRSEHMDFEY